MREMKLEWSWENIFVEKEEGGGVKGDFDDRVVVRMECSEKWMM